MPAKLTPIEELDKNITGLCTRINAATYEVLEIPDIVDTSWSVRQADAFINMMTAYLSGEGGQANDNYLVTIHVDEAALAGDAGRSSVPIESVKRHCCDGRAVVITETSEGEPLAIGRKSRIVPTGIERAVRARDNNTCTFPGCRNHRFLNCHHVEHWCNEGDTNLGNLLLLCTRHHTLVHEGGFRAASAPIPALTKHKQALIFFAFSGSALVR